MSLVSKLNCRIDLYSKIEVINEIGEKDFEYGKIKSIWAEIVPNGGSNHKIEGNVSYADISYKIIIRANSIKNITNDMYFVFKGQRYDIKYFNPNYKYRDRIEVICSLVVE